ncbi:MAG: DUF1415 domain-containing protein [candidate division Zixibacteria bacterium]|nr:DUF1415 domain-containing protein [candidate division Zixibacteria bacterium]
MDVDRIVRETQAWIHRVVVGLNLCPFASGVFDTGKIRYAVTPATAPEALAHALRKELLLLHRTAPEKTETSLLIHPCVLGNFYLYNDFLDTADAIIRKTGMEGIVQIAGFHPGYRFAGTHPDAPENYTNRSPYPMLHLLRESSVARAIDSHRNADAIPDTNIETMRALGREKAQQLLDGCHADAVATAL